MAKLELDMAYEGDILLLEDRNAVKQLWADGVVPYTIAAELGPRKGDIAAAFSMISDASCIHFKEHTNELNYLRIVDGKGCASHVGCVGGAQPLYFAGMCSVGNLCHELMHAIGLYHEHTRQDRDGYVTVIWDTIKPGKEGNFDLKEGDTQNLPYDFGSIMHYGTSFFSKDGSPTIVPKQEGVNLGQRKRLSQLDTERLNKLYRCGKS
ncbi:astacin-like metalloendopeptidase [Cololabis saira]|uniref:astacin-like metalloendopeptidase n=1 Tax=Cololabis saira TaxID=129043 RepID=UPI002AD54288|nr:astacin-like metalloendopeptidase [Cololabis saira]